MRGITAILRGIHIRLNPLIRGHGRSGNSNLTTTIHIPKWQTGIPTGLIISTTPRDIIGSSHCLLSPSHPLRNLGRTVDSLDLYSHSYDDSNASFLGE